MEEEKKLNFVRNGVAKLPPGFQFEPTDEELVFQYLKCKVFGLPLPACVIPEINVGQYDPWDLPGEVGQDKYFFSKSRSDYKAISSGCWKSTGETKLIISSKPADHRLIGLRKKMVFYNPKSSVKDDPTDWIMHEYHLIVTCSSVHCKSQSLKNSHPQSFSTIKEGWTICHIMKDTPISSKSRTPNKRTRDIECTGGLKLLKLDNGLKTPPQPQPSSSSSSYASSSWSSITEKSSDESDTEESSC